MELVVRPNKFFLSKASISELKEINKIWMEEVQFCKDELNFFLFLINNTFKEDKADPTEPIDSAVKGLIEFEREELPVLTRNVEIHGRFLDELLKEEHFLSEEVCREEHHKVEVEILHFMKEFRMLKLVFMKYVKQLEFDSNSVSS